MLGHHDPLHASEARGDAAEDERGGMMNVKCIDSSVAKESIEFQLVAETAQSRRACGVVQVETFHAACFELVAKWARRVIESKANDAISARGIFHGQLGTHPLGTADLEGEQALGNQWRVPA